MSDLKTWDYLLVAASSVAHSMTAAEETAGDPVEFGEPLVFWLNQTATDSAIEFSRLLREGVPAEHARVAVELTAGHAVGMQAAEEALGYSYGEWVQRLGGTQDSFGYPE